jgi:hypothetical protein
MERSALIREIRLIRVHSSFLMSALPARSRRQQMIE